jgi:predicted O-methyltransferase YrrM
VILYFLISKTLSITHLVPDNMPSPNPVEAPEHVLKLLSELHKTSLDQEATITPGSKKFLSTDKLGDLDDRQPASANADFDKLMIDKFIALDEDKCQFMYQLMTATGATNVIEAGTSFGVSTIYLALAVAKNKAATGREGKVIATEKEPEKAAVARKYWKQCGEAVEKEIDLRVGDLLKTLQTDLPQVDLLLLDS